jgi:sugar/nucleoside kinase (ribokinase family)
LAFSLDTRYRNGGEVGRAVEVSAIRFLDDERIFITGDGDDDRTFGFFRQDRASSNPQQQRGARVVERLAALHLLGLDRRVGELHAEAV